MFRAIYSIVALAFKSIVPTNTSSNESQPLKLRWQDNYLTIYGEHLPGNEMQIHYLEAYCRDKSTNADWLEHTKIPHETELLSASNDGTAIKSNVKLKMGWK